MDVCKRCRKPVEQADLMVGLCSDCHDELVELDELDEFLYMLEQRR